MAITERASDRQWTRAYGALAVVFAILTVVFGLHISDDDEVDTMGTVASPSDIGTGSGGGAVAGPQSTIPTDGGAGATAGPVTATPAVDQPSAAVVESTDKQGIGGGVIKLGTILPLSIGIYGEPMLKSLQAFVRSVNDAGGINGSKLQVIAYDDGVADQNKAKAAVKRLVEVDKVFALVGGWTPVTSVSTYPYLESKGVPWIGNDAFLPAEFNSPIGFPVAPSQLDTGSAQVKFAYHQLGCKRQAFIYLNLESTILARDEAMKMYAHLGIEPVADERYEATDADFTPLVLRLRSANPDCIIAESSAPDAIKLHNAMQQQNFKVPVIGTTGSAETGVQAEVDPEWLHGTWVARITEPNDSPSPAVKEFLDTLRRYYGGDVAKFKGPWPMVQWLSGKVLVEMLKAIPPDQLSRSALIEVLNSTRDLRTGLAPPLSWAPGQHHLNTMMKFAQFDKDALDWLGRTPSYWDSGINDRRETGINA